MIAADYDIIVIGAGMAGASAAAVLAEDYQVALLEAEDQPGYHSTGRSAAIWIQNYGPPDVRLLTGRSRDFFAHPPDGFAAHPLIARRPVLVLAPEAQRAALAAMLAEGIGLASIGPEEARRLVPALRPDYAVAAAIEEDAFDIDVAALHQGFLRRFRSLGGRLGLRQRAGRIARGRSAWAVTTADGSLLHAPVVVNAAGAWGDQVAAIAGLRPLGLQPCRRSAAIIDPSPWPAEHWPLVNDVAHTWYARPEARTRLMVSPADETPVPPQDIQPDELDIATGIDRMQQALDIPVRRVEHSWAGLRTFTPDRSLAFGWDAHAEGFFWCVGQGGYGIQTAPAAGALVADMIARRDPGPAGALLPAIDPARFG